MALGLVWALPGSVTARPLQFPDTNVTRQWSAEGNPYMSGGFSLDERRVMEQAAQAYNLKLLFSSRVGAPAVPAFLVIGANDGSPIEKISLHGPWFYIQLPAGSYTIMARFKHHVVLVRDVYLQDGRQQTYILRGGY